MAFTEGIFSAIIVGVKKTLVVSFVLTGSGRFATSSKQADSMLSNQLLLVCCKKECLLMCKTALQTALSVEPFQMAPTDCNIWACQLRVRLRPSGCPDCRQEIYQGGVHMLLMLMLLS